MRATSSALTGKSSRGRSAWGSWAGRPSTAALPLTGDRSPARTRNRVVLPPPLGPSTHSEVPGSSAKVTASSAGGALP